MDIEDFEKSQVGNNYKYENSEGTVKLFCTVYKILWDKEIEFDKNEIEKIEMWSVDEIKEKSKTENITPYSKECF